MAKALEGAASFQRCGVTASVFGLTGIAIAITAFALSTSLPNQITPDNYARYILADRLFAGSLVLAVLAISCGLFCRNPLPIAIGILCMFCFGCGSLSGQFLHSKPDPKTWCFINLKELRDATEKAENRRLSTQPILTNDTVMTTEEINRYLVGGFNKLRCVEGGRYVIGGVGLDTKCSVHGSLTDMSTNNWQIQRMWWVVNYRGGLYGIGEANGGTVEIFFGKRRINPSSIVSLNYAVILLPTIVTAACLAYGGLLYFRTSRNPPDNR